MRKKVVKVTKITRVLKVSEILGDILSDVTDEELLEKYGLGWKQLEKVYCKLFLRGIHREGSASEADSAAGR